MARPIGTLGTIDTITIGERVFTDLTNIIIIGGDTGQGGTFGTLRLSNGSAGYQVTAGKILTVSALKLTAGSGGTGVLFYKIAQTDNDVGFRSTTALTNPVYWLGEATAVSFVSAVGVTVGGETSGVACKFPVAALKYVTAIDDNSIAADCVVYAYGYEA